MLQKLPWLALRAVNGVGLVLFQRLVSCFGSPGAVFEASREDLLGVRGVSPAAAQAILDFRDWDRMEAQLQRVKGAGAEVLTWDDPDFPSGLRQIPYPPPVLFVQGGIIEEDRVAVALVGTRKPSCYGVKTCRRLAGGLAARGVTVVSGLARGIDTAAHQGALEEGGRTLAVLGCGLDVVYPPENRELYRKIPEAGALITEFDLGARPEAANFPRRNRLISGLSLGVVVVEAGVKSGTNITVRFALDQGREVFAVPGPVDAPGSVGPHSLIQQGAKLVREVKDILEELPGVTFRPPGTGVKEPGAIRSAPLPDDPVLAFLGAAPIQLEELVAATHLAPAEVLSRLTMLEIQGLVRELPGKCYVLEN